jgi:glutaredoxin 3
MLARAEGCRTVPQIFIDDIGIGGYDELYSLEKKGTLDTLLAGLEQ